MGSSYACAVGPGMMLAVGKLSHGNGNKAEVNKGGVATPAGRPRDRTTVGLQSLGISLFKD